MFNKVIMAAAVAIAAMLMGGQSEAKADHCRGGGYGYGYAPAVSVYRAPVYSSYRYAPRPVHSYHRSSFGYGGVGFGGVGGFYGSPYRSNFGGYGFGSPFYGGRGTSIGVGRGGFSIGIGF